MMVSERGLLLYGSPVSIPSTSMLVGSIVQAGAVVVKNCIEKLLPSPLLKISNFPFSGEATVLRKEEHLILHLLYFPIVGKEKVQIVEDCIPLRDVEVFLKAGFIVEKVMCVPDGEHLAFEQKNEYVNFVVLK